MPDVFNALQVYIGSAYVNDFNLFGRTFRVTAQADDAVPRATSRDVLKIRVRNASGDTVPLGSFTTVRDISGPYRVPRYNLYPRRRDSTAPPRPAIRRARRIATMEKLAAETLPEGFAYRMDDARLPADQGRQHRDVRLRAGGGVRVPGAGRAV